MYKNLVRLTLVLGFLAVSAQGAMAANSYYHGCDACCYEGACPAGINCENCGL